jgi:hypothetical protein
VVDNTPARAEQTDVRRAMLLTTPRPIDNNFDLDKAARRKG